MISPLRFFLVAPLHSRYMLMGMTAVLLAGIVTLFIDPTKGANVLGPLALLQMLAASSGFVVSARRGHLDLLLTAGPGRMSIALTHLAFSVLPGMAVWWTLGIVEMLLARTARPSAFASGSVVAISAISAVAWALTVGLPRLSGGIAWLLGISVWIVAWSDGPAVMAAAADATTNPFMRAAVIALCPFVLLGRRLSPDELVVVLPLVVAGSALSVAAISWIVSMDVPLESAQ